MRVPVLVPKVEGNYPKADGIHRSDEDLTNKVPMVLQTNRLRTVFTNDLYFDSGQWTRRLRQVIPSLFPAWMYSYHQMAEP
jgi:hypothetical protein